MHLSSFVATLLTVAPLVASHGDGHVPGAPRLWGRRAEGPRVAGPVQEKRMLTRPHHVHKRGHLSERANTNTDGQCGSGFGNCAPGYCCSSAGWCGLGSDYCAAPDCQLSYGSGCDANKVPPGSTTSSIARTKVGSVPYGGDGIYACTVPGMVALTYDDGPYIYTDGMLDVLAKYNVKATFFITGNNLGKGEIDNAYYPWVNVIKRMYSEGHQIASHTWSHQDLSAITAAQRLNQMYYNEMAFRNILGLIPTYMRPPYSSCTSASGCPNVLGNLGYHITYFDLDTEDYLNTLPTQIQTAKNDFSGNLTTRDPSTGSWLEIAHDIHQQTAQNLTEFMITYALARGWKFGTVGECLGDPQANWYRAASGGSVFTSAPSSTAAAASTTQATSTLASPTAVSTDAACGPNGRTCLNSGFGNCCSAAGWCGSDTPYCGTGCQPLFGNCGSNGGSNTSSSAAGSAKSSSSTTTKTSSSSTAASPTAVSTDAACGANGRTCLNSGFGDCCSAAGWCGSDTPYCGTGCQPLYGNCGTSAGSSSSSSSSKPSSSSTKSSASSSSSSLSSSRASTSSSVATSSSNSSVSSSKSSTLTSNLPSTSTSVSASISSPSSYKSTGMSSSTSSVASVSAASLSSGASSGSSSTKPTTTSSRTSATSSSPSPSSSLKVSQNAKCGGTSGQTCLGSAFGNCCSAIGFCGSGTPYCGSGCQPGFGQCSSASSSSSSSIRSSTSSSTKTSSSSTASGNSGLIKSMSSTSATASSGTSSSNHAIQTSPSATSLPKSTNGKCGKAAGTTCDGYSGGSCCGADNTCTDDMWKCFQFLGCQDDYGTCWNF